MNNEASESLSPEVEPLPETGQDEQTPAGNPDYVSDLRDALESEAAVEPPKRKTGFFERFTNRLKPIKSPPVSANEQDAIKTEPAVDQQTDIGSLASLEVSDLATELSLAPAEKQTETGLDRVEEDEVDFSESVQIGATNSIDDRWHVEEQYADAPEPTAEEPSQWKAFLATLGRSSETKSSDDVLDDETVFSRIERSLLTESQAEKERSKFSEEALPFVFLEDEQNNDLPDGKKITGSLVVDENEDVFSEGEENIWSSFRQEIIDSEEQPVDDFTPEIVQEQEFETRLTEVVSGWGEHLPEQDNSEEDVYETEIFDEDAIGEYKSQPFSEEYAEVFGEAEPLVATAEPEVSVQEIRTIVMENYEEPPEETRGRVKPSARRLRVILTVLIGVGLVLVAGIFFLPVVMQWFQPPAQALVAAVQPPTPIPMDGMPHPTGLRMTGGWFFYLQPSTIENGQWVPTTSEWLAGSELRRIVALPWTRQLEAVLRSLVNGDTIELHMSNGDVLTFLVDEISQVDRSDVSIFSSNTPSLALVLYKEGDDLRWVVIANQLE